MIVNKTVFVPLGSNSTYNNNALAVYQEALPGYEIIGVTGANSTPWENTDALHCRTRGVMDFDMLFVDHRNVVFGEQPMQDSIAITSKFIAYSGQALKQDSLLVYYSIDGGAYRTAKMTATGNPYEYVGYIKGYHYGSSVDYYVFGADESGHRYSQPSFGAVEPHHFDIEEGPTTIAQTFTLPNQWSWWSTYLDINLTQLEEALGTAGVAISSQDNGFTANYSGTWLGGLQTVGISISQMYKIQLSEAIAVTISSAPVDPADYPITLNQGANWIGYPVTQSMSLSDAFSGADPVNGDMVSALNASAMYYNGSWYGELHTLEPGMGYIYTSNASGSKTFVYPTSK